MPGARGAEAAPNAKRYVVSTREGKRSVTTYIGPKSFAQLQHLSVDDGKPVLELVREALDLFFEKRGLPLRTSD